MSDYSELKRLADYCTRLNGESWYAEESKELDSIPCFSAEMFIAAASPVVVLGLIAENERLSAVEEEATAVVDRLAELLAGVAVAVRGPEEALKRHSYHDLPERVKAAIAERDQLKAENEALRATASLSQLLPDLDDALEDLELHGRHGDQGYRKLKDWYRKMALACAAIDAAMSKDAQS